MLIRIMIGVRVGVAAARLSSQYTGEATWYNTIAKMIKRMCLIMIDILGTSNTLGICTLFAFTIGTWSSLVA